MVTRDWIDALWDELVTSEQRAMVVQEPGAAPDKGLSLQPPHTHHDSLEQRLQGLVAQLRDVVSDLSKTQVSEVAQGLLAMQQAQLEDAHEELAAIIDEREGAEGQYLALAERSNDAIAVVQDGLIVYANERMRELSGYSTQAISGKRFGECIHNLDRDMVLTRSADQFTLGEFPSAYAFRLMDRLGWTRWVETTSFLVHWDGQPAVAHMLQDVSGQARTLELLSETERRYRSLFEGAPLGLYRTAPDGRLLDANPALLHLLGWDNPDPSSEVSTTARSLSGVYVDPEDRERWKQLMRSEGAVNDFETRWHKADGSVIWVLETARCIRDEMGNLLYFEGSVRDVTERAQAEAEIRRLLAVERERRLIADSLRQSAVVLSSTLEVEDVLALILDQLSEVLRYDSASVQRLRDDQLEILASRGFADPSAVNGIVFPVEPKFPNFQVAHDLVPLAFEDVTEQYPHFRDEAEKYSSGSIRSWLGLPLLVKDQFIGMISLERAEVDPFGEEEISLATTFASQAALALENAAMFEVIEERRQHLEAVLRAAPNAVVALDARHRIVEWNKGAEELYGWTADEARGRDLDELITRPDDREDACALTQTALAGLDVPNMEATRYRKDGSPVEVRLAGAPIVIGDESRGVVAIYTDITEQKKAEQQLRQRYQFESLLADLSATFVSLPGDEIEEAVDDSLLMLGRIAGVDHCLLCQFSEDQSTLRFTNAWSGTHAESVAKVIGAGLDEAMPWFARKMRSGEGVVFSAIGDLPVEASQEVKRFQQMGIDAGVFVPLKVGGVIIGVLGVAMATAPSAWSVHMVQRLRIAGEVLANAFARSRADEALRSSEARYRLMAENATDMISRHSTKGVYRYASPASCELLGLDPEDLVGHSVFEFVHPDDVKAQLHTFPKLKDMPHDFTNEYRIRRKDGTYVWVESVTRAVRDPGSKWVKEFIAVTRDITDRKEAEEQNRLLTEAAAEAIVVAQEGMLRFANPQTEELTGYSHDELLEISYLDWVHPDDRDLVLDQHGKRMDGQDTSGRYTFRVLDKTGNIKWAEVNAVRIQWDGRPASLSFLTDISEHRTAQEALRQSEYRLRTILDVILTGVAIVDAETHEIIDVNPVAEQIIGLPKEEIVGRVCDEFVCPDTTGNSPITDEGNRAEAAECVLLKANGVEVPALKTVVPMDLMGKRYLVESFLDISDRKRAEEELEAERNLLRTLIDNIPDAIYAKDNGGRFVLSNLAAARIVGVGQPADLLGLTDFDFYPKELADEYRADELRVAKTGKGLFNHEEPLLDLTTGRKGWLSTTKVPLIDPQGDTLGLVGIGRDVTERKEAAERLAEQAKELARSNAELQQFAYVASHDLQEPLRKIRAFGGRLYDQYDGSLDERGQQYLERMLDAAGRGQSMINDLLTYSRVTTRGQAFVPVDMNEVMIEVVDMLEARIERSGGTVEAGPLPLIEADSTQMFQLLQNLVGNALKFHRPDTPPEVRVIAGKPQDGMVRIEVSDNGIGLDEKHLDRIFQPFQRLHSRAEYDGSGIGLAICRKIAERHGGSITGRSNPGEGATFVVTLPTTHSQGGSGID